MRASGTLSDGDGAAGGQHGHAEPIRFAQGKLREASRRHADRPFAALRVTSKGHPIQLRAISAQMPSRPRAYGILDLCLRLMHIGADKSAVGTVNRPLRLIRSQLVDCQQTIRTPVRYVLIEEGNPAASELGTGLSLFR